MNPQASLSVPLPAGRMLSSPEERPLLWLSDDPLPVGLWSRLFAESARSGWWPLLVEDFERDPDRFLEVPTIDGFTALTDHDPAGLLAAWWEQYAGSAESDTEEATPHPETAPFGQVWPGTVRAASLKGGAAEETAAECAELIVEHWRQRSLRLGLVQASSGAQALLACGWSGPLNYDNDTAVFAAVVADWERRFGGRVLGLGFDTLTLSVAAPPTDIDGALCVAAEHFAFCPDLVWQGSSPHTLRAYAERLVDRPVWDFWWD